MKLCFVIISLVICCLAYGQDRPYKRTWKDTSFINVALTDTLAGKKIVAMEIGGKATIYLEGNTFRDSTINTMKIVNAADKKYYERIIHVVDSGFGKSDTAFVGADLLYVEYLVADQLEMGHARVYYKKEQLFVRTISHRLEKYGMYAHRFFYLPDRRPFYSVMEYSGIIENNKYFSDPNELMELGKKLSGLRSR